MSGIHKDQPFALYDGLWHALESTEVSPVFPINKMVCGIEVRVTLEGMTTRDGDPKPQPLCLVCVERFYN